MTVVQQTVRTCGLCHQEAELRDSHLLPASVYRLAREPGTENWNPNPIIVTDRGAVATSRQVSERFLCSECEDHFSKGGESAGRLSVARCDYEEGSLKPTERLAPRQGEWVNLIVVRQPDPNRWNLERLAKSQKGEDVALAEQGLAEWASKLDEEDRR